MPSARERSNNYGAITVAITTVKDIDKLMKRLGS